MSLKTGVKEFLSAIPSYVKYVISGLNRFVVIELSDTSEMNSTSICRYNDYEFMTYVGSIWINYSTIKFGGDRVFISDKEYARSIMDDRMYNSFENNHIIINMDNANVYKVSKEICDKILTYNFKYAKVYLTDECKEEIIDGHFYVSDKRELCFTGCKG